MPPYLHATPESGRHFVQHQQEGPVLMLNLLRFRVQADYTASPELAPETPISGKEAYRTYMACVQPLLEKVGSQLLFSGKGGNQLIGPEAEQWDLVLLVQHPSVADFLSFANDADYLAIAGHRTAALMDSRLLPIQPFQVFA
ncbi:MAG: DUF1330 domain-containing protein [Bacteroidota bacterium]